MDENLKTSLPNDENEILEQTLEENDQITDFIDETVTSNNIQILEEQITSLNEKLMRAVAESENLRKRYEKMIEDTREYAVTNFAKDMISAKDNLTRALKHSLTDNSKETVQLLQGLNMVIGEIESAFKRNGLTIINPTNGENFDYNFHHAISQIADVSMKDNTIINTMQQGYKIKDRLIRPAIVSVVKN